MQQSAPRSLGGEAVKHLIPLVAGLFLIVTFLPKTPTPPPAVTGPVAAALRSAPSADRAYIAGIYKALADVTRRDQGRQITTTSVWRAVHQSALRLAADSSNVKGKYKGLDVAVEETLAQHFSLDEAPMTDELMEQIVAGCKDVEAQCLGN